MRPISLHKLRYYVRQLAEWPLPASLFRARRAALLRALDTEPDRALIQERVAYCNAVEAPFEVSPGTRIGGFRDLKHSTYFFDARRYFRYFPAHLRVDYRFGDHIDGSPSPVLTKARPVGAEGRNCVLLKLNRVRHFRFVNDRTPYEKKRDGIVWRGLAYRPQRQALVRRFYAEPRCNIGQTNPNEDVPWQKPFLGIREQLGYKFILSVEGNDVATNLKWAMASNSLCFMARPRYETWFLEGQLQPEEHYVELAPDHSDLPDKMEHYLSRPDEAREIIRRANQHVVPFRDERRETLVSLLVLEKYFERSGQL